MNITLDKQEAILLFLYCGKDRNETIRNLREMALDGYCVNMDFFDIRELVSLLRRCSNNLNQYSKKANETGSIYAKNPEKTERRDALLSSVRSAEKQITEIAALRKHIFNYSNTRATYEACRKAGYSRKFFEAHREEITIHKAAKKARGDLGPCLRGSSAAKY